MAEAGEGELSLLAEETRGTDQIFRNGREEDSFDMTEPSRQHLSSSSSYYSDEESNSQVAERDKFDNLSHWVCCVCVVTFDLELGQALEVRSLVCLLYV